MPSPTCIIEFADGEITRMTVWCEPGKRDEPRGIKLAQHAYRSRTGREPTAVKAVRWEERP